MLTIIYAFVIPYTTFRDNLEWISKATNWSKFSAVASLGVIHKGHEKDAMRILDSYLPKDTGAGTSGYMEGGGLYALGKFGVSYVFRLPH